MKKIVIVSIVIVFMGINAFTLSKIQKSNVTLGDLVKISKVQAESNGIYRCDTETMEWDATSICSNGRTYFFSCTTKTRMDGKKDYYLTGQVAFEDKCDGTREEWNSIVWNWCS